MSWHPADLVTDADLRAYERTVLTQFKAVDWQDRRQKALEDWLFPLLEGRGFPAHRFRTRHAPVSALGYTSSTFSDKTSVVDDSDGLNLATILAASTDYLYLGFDEPFRGLSVRMLDNVNAVAATVTLQTWADGWISVNNIVNGTVVGTKPFAKGGAITWTLPEDVVARSVNNIGPAYWVRLAVSSSPTAGTLAGPISVIRRSRLCAAVTLRTLALIFREAPTSQEGPWEQKAQWYEQEADRAWLRVVDQIGGEFDADDDDVIGEDDRANTAAEASGGGWRWERA